MVKYILCYIIQIKVNVCSQNTIKDIINGVHICSWAILPIHSKVDGVRTLLKKHRKF